MNLTMIINNDIIKLNTAFGMGDNMTNIDKEELERLRRVDEKTKERFRKQNAHTNTIYDRINFTVPAGKKAEIEAAAKAAGMSLNAFCRDAVLSAVSVTLRGSDDIPDFMRD